MPNLKDSMDLVLGTAAVMGVAALAGRKIMAGARWFLSRLAPRFGVSNSASVEAGFADMRQLITELSEKIDSLAISRKEVDDSLGESVDEIREELRGVGSRLDRVEYQLQPNGGGSLRDHVTRLEGRVETLLNNK